MRTVRMCLTTFDVITLCEDGKISRVKFLLVNNNNNNNTFHKAE